MKTWLPVIIICIATAAMLSYLMEQQNRERVAKKVMPAGTLYLDTRAKLDDVPGSAARTSDGRWWFLPAGSETFQEVKP